MKKPEFDIYQFADLSTKYITKEDGRGKLRLAMSDLLADNR
jgi:hypothetical protein